MVSAFGSVSTCKHERGSAFCVQVILYLWVLGLWVKETGEWGDRLCWNGLRGVALHLIPRDGKQHYLSYKAWSKISISKHLIPFCRSHSSRLRDRNRLITTCGCGFYTGLMAVKILIQLLTEKYCLTIKS